MKKQVTSIAVAAILAASVAVPSAEALQAASFEPYASLPYVEDVNPCGNGYIATVSCAGSAKSFALKVTSKGKAVKARKESKRVWTVKLRKGAYYKLSVRAKGGKWKSIGYRVY